MVLSANVIAFSAFDAPKLTRDEWDMLYSSNYPYNKLYHHHNDYFQTKYTQMKYLNHKTQYTKFHHHKLKKINYYLKKENLSKNHFSSLVL